MTNKIRMLLRKHFGSEWFVVAIVALFIFGYASYKILGADNIVEEISEQILKDKFGIDVEFSPLEDR